jgi:hypothetical protein
MRLQTALELLSPAEREALRVRRGVRLDPRKRLDEIEQTARALVAETDLRHSKFPPEVRQLLQRLAVVGGTLQGGANDPGAKLLCDLGIAFRPPAAVTSTPATGRSSRASKSGTATGPRLAVASLVLPSAFLVQVPVGESEDPQSLRACFSMIDPEIVGPMAALILNKPLAVTGALAVQEVWEVLSGAGFIEKMVQELPSAEARLLDAIERVGGEVTTEELLALDQAPGLYRTQSGIAVPKRGAPYMLQRRGLLFQLGVERFVVPTEVARIVGAPRQTERAARQASIEAAVRNEDHAPHRARYARDPSLALVATLAMLRTWEVPVRPDVAVARAALKRVSERLGEQEEAIAMLVALARAAGFGRLATPLAAAVGSLQLRVHEVGSLLARTYEQGGAWDETRVEPEVLRSGIVARATTSVVTARRVLLDALEVVARDRWVPVDAVIEYAATDPRYAAVQRLHERATRERPGVFKSSIEEALRLMLTRSLPTLGLLDIAEDGAAVRLVGRSVTGSSEHRAAVREGKATVSRTSLDVPSSSWVHAVLDLADVGEFDHIKPDPSPGSMVFSLGAAALTRGRARGLTGQQVEGRFRAIGMAPPFASAVNELITGLSDSREASFVAASGIILTQDAQVRAELRADPSVRRMLVEVEGVDVLLVRPDADIERLQTRLARLGVRLMELRPATTSTPPATTSTAPAQNDSAEHPIARGA